MDGYKVFWGDFHKHLAEIERADEIMQAARTNLDFYPVLCYPFKFYEDRGLRVETVRQRPEFLEWWRVLQEMARRYNEPGRFVTFLGYEWHGNRTHYGDHNVIYFDPENPLDDAWILPELYANMRTRRGIVIPHHTAYLKHQRGKDWDVLDEQLSPVMEIYSAHGCSEGCRSPVPMLPNVSMGPRAPGGGLVDALDRGYRIGVIACNDGGGLPGSWGRGLAALWAKELTREALWDALMERRTYGVTGDRIRLAYWGNSAPMGSLLKNAQRLDVLVDVTCSDELFTIEVIHNGKVAASYCHAGGWDDAAALPGKVKLQVQWGWGPKDWYGFPREPVTWNFGLSVNRGRLASVEPRRWDFSFTQRERTDTRYAFSSVTSTQARAANFQPGSVVLELEATHETELALEGEGIRRTWKVADLLARGEVIVLWDEVYERVRKQFGLGLSDIENPDSFYHNARKVKITRAIPEAAYRVQKRFAGLPIQPGRRNYTYVRVIQRNGQVAWSSPVWVDA